MHRVSHALTHWKGYALRYARRAGAGALVRGRLSSRTTSHVPRLSELAPERTGERITLLSVLLLRCCDAGPHHPVEQVSPHASADVAHFPHEQDTLSDAQVACRRGDTPRATSKQMALSEQ